MSVKGSRSPFQKSVDYGNTEVSESSQCPSWTLYGGRKRSIVSYLSKPQKLPVYRRLQTLSSHPTFAEPQVFRRAVTNKHTTVEQNPSNCNTKTRLAVHDTRHLVSEKERRNKCSWMNQEGRAAASRKSSQRQVQHASWLCVNLLQALC